MAVADKTIDPKILDSARQEFLKNGFGKASLKEICSKAGVTTGALYKRYTGKDELFCAVVKNTVDDLNLIISKKLEKNISEMTDKELMDTWNMDEKYMLWWFSYLNERYDDFVLLLKCSTGSSYYNFAATWVEKMTMESYRYYVEAYERKLASTFVTEEEMRVLITAFWTGIYEPFIRGMKWDKIENHCILMCKFINWHNVLGFKPV